LLFGPEQERAHRLTGAAAELALRSPCLRSRCAAVIASGDRILGRGWNGPPRDVPIQLCRKDVLPLAFRSDRTCCLHAEQRAVADALAHHAGELPDATLYFIRLDEHGRPKRSGEPYCTICSKLCADIGLAEFVLWQRDGYVAYECLEYNEVSFAHAA